MTAAMPTPTSEKTSVNCANPAIGMLAPVLSANETPAADAIAARTVVATEATTAEVTPCFHTGCRSAAGVGALGVARVGICLVVDISGSVSSAGRPVRLAPTPSTNGRVRIRQVARRSVLRVDARCRSTARGRA